MFYSYAKRNATTVDKHMSKNIWLYNPPPLSKNDITSKRKAGKFITQAEKAFYMTYTEEQHHNAVINFLIYIARKGCVSIDTSKDVTYNRD